MSTPIKRLVEDADFLVSGGRYEGALVQLLVAVAASSTKMFPAGTASIDSPAVKPGKFNEMRDGEKFKRFLGTRIRKLLMNDPFATEDGQHHSLIGFVGGLPHPEEVLYDQYRNAMIHEGQLPAGVTFSPDTEHQNSIGISFNSAGVTFSSGLLNLLKRAVVEAPINGREFGIAHFRLTPRSDETFDNLHHQLASEFQTTPGRICVLLDFVQQIGPNCFTLNDVELKEKFAQLTGGRRAVGLQTSFYGPAFCEVNGKLTNHGLAATRKALESLKFVDISA